MDAAVFETDLIAYTLGVFSSDSTGEYLNEWRNVIF